MVIGLNPPETKTVVKLLSFKTWNNFLAPFLNVTIRLASSNDDKRSPFNKLTLFSKEVEKSKRPFNPKSVIFLT